MTPFFVEEKLQEVIELLEADGYWPLVQRDRSLWNSIYILLCLPPFSQSKPPRKTSYAIRVADHPPRPDKTGTILVSIHPGQCDAVKQWREAKALMRADANAKKQDAERLKENVEQYYRFRDMRKKYR